MLTHELGQQVRLGGGHDLGKVHIRYETLVVGVISERLKQWYKHNNRIVHFLNACLLCSSWKSCNSWQNSCEESMSESFMKTFSKETHEVVNAVTFVLAKVALNERTVEVELHFCYCLRVSNNLQKSRVLN